MSGPGACNPAALALLAEQVPRLETTAGLVLGATAVALHDMPEVQPTEVLADVARLAERVRARVSAPGDPQALLAHAHALLFDELDYGGNADDYYEPRNSYLPAVLQTRRGLPITLALLYKAVLEPLGLAVEGINAPGHFLARVFVPGSSPSIVDPFFGGGVLSRAEAWKRIEQAIGRPVAADDQLLCAATHRQWLARILRNLQNLFERRRDAARLAAMQELAALLPAT